MDSPIPQDTFSRTLRQSRDNPGALRAASTVPLIDFYGNAETWVIETYRIDGSDLVFLQRSSASGALQCVVLPVEVSAVLARHRDQLTLASRRRHGRKAKARQ